jgi:hypothetical protein
MLEQPSCCCTADSGSIPSVRVYHELSPKAERYLIKEGWDHRLDAKEGKQPLQTSYQRELLCGTKEMEAGNTVLAMVALL